MFELDVTRYVLEEDCSEFSASVFERGDNVGQETWEAALREVRGREPSLLTEEQVSETRVWLRGFGAWTQEEIDAYGPDEVEALLLQFIAGDIREMEGLFPDDPEGYRAAQEAGTCQSRLYYQDEKWLFTVGD